jgi:hypothetical protein
MSVSMKFDVQSDLELRWTLNDAETIQLGEAFLAHESALPELQQLKDLPPGFFVPLISRAKTAAAEASAGEAQRAQAAEAVRQAMEQAQPLLDKVILHLKSRHANNLAELEQWGLKTKPGARGVSVTKPNNDSARRDFLLAYVTKEATLPPAQQIADPPLSELQALAETVQQNRADRTEQANRRLLNVANRTAASQHLLDALQAAAAILIVKCFNGQVTRDLQAWGFNLVAKNGGNETPPPAETPAA